MTTWLTTARLDRLRRRLHEIPDMLALVETIAATRLPRMGTPGASRPTPGSRPPVNLAAIDLTDDRRKLVRRDERNPWLQANRADPADDPKRVHTEDLDPPDRVQLERDLGLDRRYGILPTLESWVRLADGEMCEAGEEHVTPAETPTITTEAGWLAQHLDWIAEQQFVTELERDVAGIWRDVQAMLNEASVEVRIGCIRPGCGGRMLATSSHWTCSRCGETSRRLREHVARSEPMTAAMLTRAFPTLSLDALRRWVKSGRLDPATDDVTGEPITVGRKPTFRAGEVMRLMTAESVGVSEADA